MLLAHARIIRSESNCKLPLSCGFDRRAATIVPLAARLGVFRLVQDWCSRKCLNSVAYPCFARANVADGFTAELKSRTSSGGSLPLSTQVISQRSAPGIQRPA